VVKFLRSNKQVVVVLTKARPRPRRRLAAALLQFSTLGQQKCKSLWTEVSSCLHFLIPMPLLGEVIYSVPETFDRPNNYSTPIKHILERYTFKT